MTEPLDDARGELRKVCHAGGDLGCSCADRNYQWFDHACREQIVTAFKNILNAQAARPAPVPQCEAEPWRCPHDMGFDNELGPLGCLLVSKSLECVCENHHFATPPSRSDASADSRCDAESREVLIHTICPHIKQWSDGEDVVDSACQKCPATVETSHGTGVQMCRLNAEKAADAILALSPDPGTVAVASTEGNTP